MTLALFAMVGMLGLVVDLGWSYFVRKSAQAAADSAALAAVRRAMDLVGGSRNAIAYSCGVGGSLTCTAAGAIDCPGAAGNLSAACLYAQQNGFTTGGRQHVTVEAGDQSLSVADPCGLGGATVHRPPTTGCVDTFYWVTVRVSEQIPQLFSAILGNSLGLVSARATAAVASSAMPGALWLIGRGEPWNPSGGPVPLGTNLYIAGGPRLVVPPGINLASAADGPKKTGWAGYISGGGEVIADQTYIRGGYDISGNGSWVTTPVEHANDGPWFEDPFTGMGQPPISTSSSLPLYAVQNGTLTCNPCGPGNYYAVRQGANGWYASGDPIVINSNVTFTAGGNAFGDYNFFGGVQIGGAQVTFGPGRYVLAGVKDQSTPLFNNDNKAMLMSSGQNGSDTGRIFILTDSTYPGLDVQVRRINAQNPITGWPGPAGSDGLRTLYFSKSSIKAGNNASSSVQLYGLNAAYSDSMPTEQNVAGSFLKNFALWPINGTGAGVVIWQDQRNSYVTYDDHGYVEFGTCTIDSPCMNAYPADPSESPQLEIWSSPWADLQGVIYQPRGAWTLVQASGDYTGALRIVSGSMKFQGSGTLTMTGVGSPLTTYVTALIE